MRKGRERSRENSTANGENAGAPGKKIADENMGKGKLDKKMPLKRVVALQGGSFDAG